MFCWDPVIQSDVMLSLAALALTAAAAHAQGLLECVPHFSTGEQWRQRQRLSGLSRRTAGTPGGKWHASLAC